MPCEIRQDEGLLTDVSTLTTGKYLTDRVKCDRSENTHERCKSLTRNWLIPAIGHVKLTALTTRALNQLIHTRLTGGEQEASPDTHRKYYVMLKASLNNAVDLKVLLQNSMIGIKVSDGHSPRDSAADR